ncbi:MAG: PIN domain nuclease [Sterolibacterium sp.]|jgi:hypothetical protein
MIVVDSSVWIDYFNGMSNPETEKLDAALGNELIVIGDLILAEVLQGFERDADYRKAKSLLEHLEFREMLGREVALASAENYRKLRQQGITIRKTIDMLIGTFCILNRLPLLHRDRDFAPMAKHLGLLVVQ